MTSTPSPRTHDGAIGGAIALSLLGIVSLFIAGVIAFLSQLAFFGEQPDPMSTRESLSVAAFAIGALACWFGAGLVGSRRRPAYCWFALLGPGLIVAMGLALAVRAGL